MTIICHGKYGIYFRTLTILVAIIFLSTQLLWAGGGLETLLNPPYNNACTSKYSPSEVDKSYTNASDHIKKLNDIERLKTEFFSSNSSNSKNEGQSLDLFYSNASYDELANIDAQVDFLKEHIGFLTKEIKDKKEEAKKYENYTYTVTRTEWKKDNEKVKQYNSLRLEADYLEDLAKEKDKEKEKYRNYFFTRKVYTYEKYEKVKNPWIEYHRWDLNKDGVVNSGDEDLFWEGWQKRKYKFSDYTNFRNSFGAASIVHPAKYSWVIHRNETCDPGPQGLFSGIRNKVINEVAYIDYNKKQKYDALEKEVEELRKKAASLRFQAAGIAYKYEIVVKEEKIDYEKKALYEELIDEVKSLEEEREAIFERMNSLKHAKALLKDKVVIDLNNYLKNIDSTLGKDSLIKEERKLEGIIRGFSFLREDEKGWIIKEKIIPYFNQVRKDRENKANEFNDNINSRIITELTSALSSLDELTQKTNNLISAVNTNSYLEDDKRQALVEAIGQQFDKMLGVQLDKIGSTQKFSILDKKEEELIEYIGTNLLFGQEEKNRIINENIRIYFVKLKEDRKDKANNFINYINNRIKNELETGFSLTELTTRKTALVENVNKSSYLESDQEEDLLEKIEKQFEDAKPAPQQSSSGSYTSNQRDSSGSSSSSSSSQPKPSSPTSPDPAPPYIANLRARIPQEITIDLNLAQLRVKEKEFVDEVQGKSYLNDGQKRNLIAEVNAQFNIVHQSHLDRVDEAIQEGLNDATKKKEELNDKKLKLEDTAKDYLEGVEQNPRLKLIDDKYKQIMQLRSEGAISFTNEIRQKLKNELRSEINIEDLTKNKEDLVSLVNNSLYLEENERTGLINEITNHYEFVKTIPAIKLLPQVINQGNLLIEWEKLENATNYTLEISQEPNFSDSIKYENIEGFSYQAADIKPSKTYYLRLRANKESVLGPWSETISVTNLFYIDKSGNSIEYNEDGRIVKITDKDGVVSSYNYETDANGSILYKIINSQGTTWKYNNADELISKIDKEGNHYEYIYTRNDAGRIIANTEISKGSIRISDSSGNKLIIEDEDGDFSTSSDQKLSYVNPNGVAVEGIEVKDGDLIYDYVSLPADIVNAFSSSQSALLLSKDGSKLSYSDGTVSSISSSDGKDVSISYEGASGNLTGLIIKGDDYETAINDSGKITAISNDEGISVIVDNGKISSLSSSEGITIDNLTLSESATIENADINLTDGTQATVSSGRVDSITNKDGKVDTVEYTEDAAGDVTGVAVLRNNGNKYEYNADGMLIKLTNDSGITLTEPTFDESGNFDGGELSFPEGAKVRFEDRDLKLVESDNARYSYSREISDDGKEILIQTNLLTNEVKRFKDGILKSSISPTGVVSEYEYEAGRVKKVIEKRFGIITATLDYIYEGQDIITTDKDGAIRRYDSNNNLVSLVTPDGREYIYTYTMDSEGNINTTKSLLVKQEIEDGVVRLYNEGDIQDIEYSNGTVINNISFNSQSELDAAVVDLPDGTKKELKSSNRLEITLPDGTFIRYIDSVIDELVTPDGKSHLSQITRNKNSVSFVIEGKTYYMQSDMLTSIDLGNGDRIAFNYDRDAENELILQAIFYYAPDGSEKIYNRYGLLTRYKKGDGTLDEKYIYKYNDSGEAIGFKVIRGEYAMLGDEIARFPFEVSSSGFEAGYRALLTTKNGSYSSYEFSWEERSGYYIMVVDQFTGDVIDKKHFKTWNDQHSSGPAEAMAAYLNSIPNGRYVLMAIADEGSMNMTDNAYRAIESLGSSKIRQVGFRDSWSMIGKKGFPIGAAIESLSKSETKQVATCWSRRDGVGYYDAYGKSIYPSELNMGLRYRWKSARPVLEEGLTEVLVSNRKQEASAYIKNFNSDYPESGFIRIWDADFNSNFANSYYLEDLVDISGNAKYKAVFYDTRYPQNWAWEREVIKNYLVARGYELLNADQLQEWMKFKGPDSLVVFAQDIAPDTVMNKGDLLDSLPRKYLERGGSIVWYKDTPFYYIGYSDGSKLQIGYEGQEKILGVTQGTNDLNEYVYLSQKSKSQWMPATKPIERAEESWINPEGVVTKYGVTLTKELTEDPELSSLIDYSQNVTTQAVYNKDGVVMETKGADGRKNIFEDGNIKKILTKGGDVISEYNYDANKNLIAVNLIDSRTRLINNIDEQRQDIKKVHDEALVKLEQEKAEQIGQLKDKVNQGLKEINKELNRLMGERNAVASQKAHGKKGRKQKNAVVDAYDRAIEDALSVKKDLEQKALNAEDILEYQFYKVRNDIIERDTQLAYESLAENEKALWSDIVTSEVMPVAVHWYRKLLGRDPGEEEITYWVDIALSSQDKRLSAQLIRDSLLVSVEYSHRESEKVQIVNEVESVLDKYLISDEAQKLEILNSYKIDPKDAIPLSVENGNKIKAYLESQGMHFGNSAYEALRLLLVNNGKNITKKDIAVDAIVIDMLTGVLTGLEEGDLELSMFALKKVAEKNNLTLYVAAKDDNKLPSSGGFITLINDNHYVYVKSVNNGKVIYLDPGIGSDGKDIELSAEEFTKIWNKKTLATTLPVGARELTGNEAKLIKGAFFGFLIPIFAAIFTGAAVVVGAVISTISLAIGAIITGISVIVQGLVHLASNALTLIWKGISFAGKGLVNIGKFIGTKLMGSLTNPVTMIKEKSILAFATQQAMSVGISLGVTKSMQELDLDPHLTNIASALISGGITGGIQSIGSNTYTVTEGAINNAITMGTIQGFREIGNAQGWDSAWTNLGAIAAGTITGALTNFNQATAPLKAIGEAIPNLMREAAYIGVESLGEHLGIDPRITTLAGIPLVEGTISTFSDRENIAKNIITGMKQGAASLALQQLANELDADPLLFSAISSVVLGTIGEMLTNPEAKFGEAVTKAVQDSVINTLTLGATIDPITGKVIQPDTPYEKAKYNIKVFDFSQRIDNAGFSDALKDYTQAVLHRSAGASFVTVFDKTYDMIEDGLFTSIIHNGQSAKLVEIPDPENPDKIKTKLIVNDEKEILAIETEDGYTIEDKESNNLEMDEKGNILNPYTITAEEDKKIFVQPLEDREEIEYDENGNILNGEIEDKDNGYKLTIIDGEENLNIELTEDILEEREDLFLEENDLTKEDLKGTTLTLDREGNISIGLPVVQDFSGDGKVLGEKISDEGLWSKITQKAEMIKNSMLLYGNRTDEELRIHRDEEAQKIKDNPNKVYFAFTKSSSISGFVVRGITNDEENNYNAVDHLAVGLEGKVLDISPFVGQNTGRNTDLNWQTVDDFKENYKDMEVVEVNLTPDQIKAVKVNLSSYVNKETGIPKDGYHYDFTQLIGPFKWFRPVLGMASPELKEGVWTICSHLGKDLIEQGVQTISGYENYKLPGLEGYQTQYSPNDIFFTKDKWGER